MNKLLLVLFEPIFLMGIIRVPSCPKLSQAVTQAALAQGRLGQFGNESLTVNYEKKLQVRICYMFLCALK